MSDDGPGTREVAYRLFAAEFDDAALSYSESDEERAPNYVVTPTGARVNRLFVAGVLTEVERVNDDTSRGRVVDPSGAFVTYAGQYQPEEAAFLERADPPTFVALTGKARTFEPDDSDRVFTSVRPESLNEVDADVRDRWVVSAAEATLDRLAVFAAALDSDLRGSALQRALEAGGASASLAAGIPKAIEEYDTSTAYVEAIRRLAVDSLELIAGEREEVRSPDLAPAEGGEAAIGPLPTTDVQIDPSAVDERPGEPVDGVRTEPADGGGAEPADSVNTGAATATDPGPTTAESEPEVEAETEQPTDSPEPITGDDADLGGVADVSGSASDVDGVGDSAPEDGGIGDADRDENAIDAASEGLGDFDDGLSDADPAGTPDPSDSAGTQGVAADPEPAVDGDPETEPVDGMYELDDEEREEIESEFGTNFSTGGEVADPGEADIDVPDPETEPGEAETAETETTGTTDVGVGTAETNVEAGETAGSDDGSDADSDGDTDPTDDIGAGDTGDTDDGDSAVDLETAAVEAMTELDDGDGADRAAVVRSVSSDHSVTEADVEDAIQDALMSGKCYEPTDGVLKPI